MVSNSLSSDTRRQCSIRAWTATTFCNSSCRETCWRKLTFLRTASTIVNSMEGHQTLSGNPGNPAPEPISSTREAGVKNATGARESTKCLTAMSYGSWMAVRLTFADHCINSCIWRKNCPTCRSVGRRPKAKAPSTIILRHFSKSIDARKFGSRSPISDSPEH